MTTTTTPLALDQDAIADRMRGHLATSDPRMNVLAQALDADHFDEFRRADLRNDNPTDPPPLAELLGHAEELLAQSWHRADRVRAAVLQLSEVALLAGEQPLAASLERSAGVVYAPLVAYAKTRGLSVPDGVPIEEGVMADQDIRQAAAYEHMTVPERAQRVVDGLDTGCSREEVRHDADVLAQTVRGA